MKEAPEKGKCGLRVSTPPIFPPPDSPPEPKEATHRRGCVHCLGIGHHDRTEWDGSITEFICLPCDGTGMEDRMPR